MGILEEEVKKQIRNTKIQKVILQTIAAAGILSIALLAPNALQMLKLFDNKKTKRYSQKHNVHSAIGRLVAAGLVKFENTKNGKCVRLTAEGERKLRIIEAMDFKIKKPKKWDKKWRLIIFDIKEERKSTRNKIRHTLGQIGFTRLQDSVWAYPYDCEDLVALLKADFKIGKDVLYIIADKIENDTFLKKSYNLA
jgi:CRISPR-associated endonuclease Cas2